MYTLHVKSLPFKDVINDLAEELGVTPQEDCEVYYLKIPDSKGHGSIRGINFNTGLGVIYYDCTFNDDVQIRFDVSSIHPAKFLYCKEGYLRHSFLDSEETHDLDQYKSAIVASKGTSGHQIQFKAGVKTEIGSLEIDRKKFITQVACDLKSVGAKMRRLFRDTEAKSKFHYSGDYSASLNAIMDRIKDYSANGMVRRLYLHAVSMEILSEQIRVFIDERKDQKHQNMLRQSEVNTVSQIAEDVKNNLAEKHLLTELTLKTGLNENKLQAGFRILFNKSVKGFIQNARMDTARDLLVNTDLTISEIVYLIGLSNGGHFSKLFKQSFGMTPTAYRTMFGRSLIRKDT
jgi:AraC-like DNA-binding protein